MQEQQRRVGIRCPPCHRICENMSVRIQSASRARHARKHADALRFARATGTEPVLPGDAMGVEAARHAASKKARKGGKPDVKPFVASTRSNTVFGRPPTAVVEDETDPVRVMRRRRNSATTIQKAFRRRLSPTVVTSAWESQASPVRARHSGSGSGGRSNSSSSSSSSSGGDGDSGSGSERGRPPRSPRSLGDSTTVGADAWKVAAEEEMSDNEDAINGVLQAESNDIDVAGSEGGRDEWVRCAVALVTKGKSYFQQTTGAGGAGGAGATEQQKESLRRSAKVHFLGGVRMMEMALDGELHTHFREPRYRIALLNHVATALKNLAILSMEMKKARLACMLFQRSLATYELLRVNKTGDDLDDNTDKLLGVLKTLLSL